LKSAQRIEYLGVPSKCTQLGVVHPPCVEIVCFKLNQGMLQLL
jgi:hypothetical protein